MRFHPLALLFALGGGDEDAVEVAILALQQGLAVLQGLLGGPDHGDEVQIEVLRGQGRGVGGGFGGWEGRRVVVGAVLDGIGGGEGALEVLEEGLAVGEGDGGDADGEGVLDVLGVLEVVVLYVVD